MLSEDQARALLDAAAYYKLSDYGHGDQRPLDAEQEQHRRDVDAAVASLEAWLARVEEIFQAMQRRDEEQRKCVYCRGDESLCDGTECQK